MAAPSCDVGRVVGERVAFWSALAEDQGRPLRLALPDRPLRARLDAADLADVVDVLIDNVFAHTDDGVPVEIWVVPRADGAVVLTVEDAGPGLPSVDIINRGSRTPAPPAWGWTSSGVPRWPAAAASSSAARGWAARWCGSSWAVPTTDSVPTAGRAEPCRDLDTLLIRAERCFTFPRGGCRGDPCDEPDPAHAPGA